MEKLAFVLIIATRKLKPYFQAHTIVVLADKPLRAMELSEFDIYYRPRTAIKGQAVAEFIAEFTLGDG